MGGLTSLAPHVFGVTREAGGGGTKGLKEEKGGRGSIIDGGIMNKAWNI